MVSFSALKNEESEVWKSYESLRKKGGLYCPAFKKTIEFTLLGWRHLIGATGNKKRTSYEKYRKLKLFPYVQTVVTNSSTIQDIRISTSHTDYALEAMTEVEYGEGKELSKVRVILREDRCGNIRFHSVMDKRAGNRGHKKKAPHASVIRRQRRGR